MLDKLRQILRDGEGITVEFKHCDHDLSDSVYQTVSAFSNRYGGHILLGVEDDGTISGIAPDYVKKIKKDFTNTLNNPERFVPTLYISLEETEIDGKIILWCYVPFVTQIVMFGCNIYDRTEDADITVTRSSDQLGMMSERKRGLSTISRVFPYVKKEDLELERLMPIVRRRAENRLSNHPWLVMSDDEIIKQAGLYTDDLATGKSGYNLAAIMLFGKENTITTCTSAAYVTDCILRRDNTDRYDDREVIKCNIIDAFNMIMDFIAKHTLDRFFIEGDQSISVRDKIARELVSNILIHREFTSTFPAKVIIGRDHILTENWCSPRYPGPLKPDTFLAQPKNPLLAAFFFNIGLADSLGSGVRNLYKVTVGNFITKIPPHRSVLAELPHTAPQLDSTPPFRRVMVLQSG